MFLFDIDFAEVLEIPTDLVSFHDQELVDDPEAALAESFYKKWRKNDAQPLRKSECLGHVKPPFLGGKDEVGNLQRIDMEVLWSIHGQLLKNMGWRYEEA